jgi:DsbC/DsbD-like thiol-disulfide interchange protein
LHVYAAPVPDGYTALAVEVSSAESLEVGSFHHEPAAHPFQVEGLDEEFQVYEGAVTVGVPLAFLKNEGDVTVTIRVRYQACSDVVCYPPDELTLSLGLTGLENIRD